jgi:Pvc16 N-terminal domain
VSTALAIAGVTQVLRDLLNDRFVNQNVAGQIGQSVTVSTMPPDKVVQQNGIEVTQLNLFMRQVTPNLGWRNEGLPSRDGSGRNRLSNPPLAVNLHYLISAYGAADLHAEILLGHAMQLLHENPVIPREAIRIALQPPPDQAGTLPPWLRALRDSGLQDQIEQLRITPAFLSTEEMSKFWTSTLAHYRPSAAYEVSVVLIQAEDPKPSPLPVLVRRVQAQPNLAPAVPTISAVVPDGNQPVVELGTTVTLKGFTLNGVTREVVLTNDRYELEEVLPASGGNASELEFIIPANRAADFPAGIYKVAALVKLPTDAEPRLSNQMALIVAPHVDNLPQVINSGGGTANITLNFVPEVREGQSVRLVLGAAEFAPQPFAAPIATLNFQIPNAPLGDHLARLRIDGIDSPIIDAGKTPPAFLDRRIKIQ